MTTPPTKPTSVQGKHQINILIKNLTITIYEHLAKKITKFFRIKLNSSKLPTNSYRLTNNKS